MSKVMNSHTETNIENEEDVKKLLSFNKNDPIYKML